MWVNRFWETVTPVRPGLRSFYRNDIESMQVFHRAIERERNRSDRKGRSFSILSYEVIGSDGQERVVKDFFDHVFGRVRKTDVVGWFDERHVAILLPETSEDAARLVAKDLCDCNGKNGGPKYRIYTYPKAIAFGSGKRQEFEGQAEGLSLGVGAELLSAEKQPDTSDDAGRPAAADCEFDGAAAGLEPYFSVSLPWWKRAMDLVISVLGLIVAAPVMIVVAVMIKVVSPGPVFFRQERVGRAGKIFELFKFRTMHVDSDNANHRKYMSHLIDSDAPMIKLDNVRDPRLIPFGQILRKSCIDELPQLFNVLKGDMSLIGPRPCLPYEAEEFLRWHTHRFDTMPGITGLWQVNGKNKTTFKQMIRYDIEYSRKVSMGMDVKILLKTVPAIWSMVFDNSKPSPPSNSLPGGGMATSSSPSAEDFGYVRSRS